MGKDITDKIYMIWGIIVIIIFTLIMSIGVGIYNDSRLDKLEEIGVSNEDLNLYCEKGIHNGKVTQTLYCDSILIAESCVDDFRIWKEENC